MEEEKKEKKELLPIGSVVFLKGGKKELMIISYCIIPAGDVYDKNGKIDLGENPMFDYGGCVYPEGMITSDQIFAFNHDQIDRVVFTGYTTEKQKQICEVLVGGMAERLKNIEENKKRREGTPVIAPEINVDPIDN